jgi:hypothetical protein
MVKEASSYAILTHIYASVVYLIAKYYEMFAFSAPFFRPIKWAHIILNFVITFIRISFRSNDIWLSYDPWTCIFVQIWSCPDFSLTSFDILTWYYIKSIYQRTSKIKFGELKIWTKNTSSRVITQPKIIRPERNSNLNCNSSRYSQICIFVQIWSCPDFSLTSFDILTWYLVFGYI